MSCSVTTPIINQTNHNLVNVGLAGAAVDSCEGDVAVTVNVFADENDDEDTGDGKHSPDAKTAVARRGCAPSAREAMDGSTSSSSRRPTHRVTAAAVAARSPCRAQHAVGADGGPSAGRRRAHLLRGQLTVRHRPGISPLATDQCSARSKQLRTTPFGERSVI